MGRAMAKVGPDEGRFGGRKRWEKGGWEGRRGKEFFFFWILNFCFLFQFSPSGREAERFAKQVQFCKSAEVGTEWGRGG